MKLKRQTLISQGSLNRLIQAAHEEWNRKKFHEAIELMRRASHLDPANPDIHLNLGRFYGFRYDYVTAERCFEKAARVSPNKAIALAGAGTLCGNFGNYAMSELFFLRALEQKDAVPKMFIQLANLYDRLRRLNEASDMVAQALQLNPKCLEALLMRAKLERQTGEIQKAEITIRSIVVTPNSDFWILAQSWYELGLILDRQGRFDEAMSAFLPAKALLNSQATRYRNELKVVRQRISLMRSQLTSETMEKWFSTASLLSPQHRIALLGGHPRSGTTLLEQVLDSHPDIASVEETEIFHDDAYMPLVNRHPDGFPVLGILNSEPIETIRQSRINYSRSVELFQGQPIGERLLIDKNPSLTFLIPPFFRIFPETKLLIALRDPRDVVMSCFMQPIPLSQGSSAYLTLEHTVEEYCSMMNLWLTLKPMIEGHYLEVRYEDMVEDLESVARKSLDFLDVPWDAKVLGFDEHARKKTVRSPTYADVTQPVYKRALGRWRNYQKYLEPHLKKLEPFVKAFGYE